MPGLKNGHVRTIPVSAGDVRHLAGPVGDATVAAVLAKLEPQPDTADDKVTRPEAVHEEDDSAAKRAIIHEWENWSALHSDELDDPNVAEYFFRHLETKRPHLLNFCNQNEDEYGALCRFITGERQIG